jgi:hypothetical protein
LDELIPKKTFRYVHRRRWAANVLRRLIEDPKTPNRDQGDLTKWYIALEGLIPLELLMKICDTSKLLPLKSLIPPSHPAEEGVPDLIGGGAKVI